MIKWLVGAIERANELIIIHTRILISLIPATSLFFIATPLVTEMHARRYEMRWFDVKLSFVIQQARRRR